MKLFSQRYSSGFGMFLAVAVYFPWLLASVLQSSAQEMDDLEDIYELSPFTVETGSSMGYQATSTLAGSRINTSLKDLGAAISVVTTEFLEDTQSHNAQDLFANLTSIEIGGPQGNFSGANLDSGYGGFNTNGYALDPQSTARVRGLETPNFTRGYFSTSIPMDAYNTSAITVSRGANSLLFGLGSAGGVVDAGLNEATLGNDLSRIGVTVDNNNSLRGTLNLARTVVEDRLAVRLDVLHGDTKYQQDPAYERSKRYYGAINLTLAKNEKSNWLGRTSIKGNIEYGEMSSTPPSPLLPADAMQSFFEAPTTDYREYTGLDLHPSQPAFSAGYDALVNTWKPYSIHSTLVSDYANAPITDTNNGYVNRVDIAIGNPRYFNGFAFPYIFDRPVVYYPNYNGEANLTRDLQGKTGRSANFNMLKPDGSTGWIRPHINVSTAWYAINQPNFRIDSLTDRNVFDYRNQLLTGNSRWIKRRFDAETVTLEQLLFNGKGGLELTLSQENFDRDSQLPFSGGGQFAGELPVQIDVMGHLADGTVNPHKGRAFMAVRDNELSQVLEERQNARLTAFYELNFADHVNSGLAKWLGHHRMTGLYQKDEKTREIRRSALFLDDPNDSRLVGEQYAWYWTQQPRVAARFAAPTYQVYLSDDLTGLSRDQIKLQPIALNMPKEGDVHKFQFIDKDVVLDYSDGSISEGYREKEWVYHRYFTGGDITKREVTSKAFVLQSYILSDHIVALYGMRSDEVDSWNRIPGAQRNGPDGSIFIDEWNTLGEKSTISGETKTWSVVAHMPQKWVNKLPVISSASVYINEGENFDAVGARNNILNESIPNPQGKTKEFGFSLGFAENKWLMKINRFETSSSFQGVGRIGRQRNAVMNSALNRFNNHRSDLTALLFEQQPVAALGFTSYEQFEQALIDSIPEPTRSLYNYELDPATNDYLATGEITNLAGTQSVNSEGWELELTGNPTPNWRITANLTQVEATTEDSVSDFISWAEQVQSNWEKLGILDMPVGVLNGPNTYTEDKTFRQILDGDVWTPLRPIQAKDGNLNQELREWRFNLATNYTFSESWLEGFSIGGALRYQSAAAIGYHYNLDDLGVMVPDVNKPYKGDASFNGDIWFSYVKRIGNKVDWKIQLNIRNAVGSQSIIPIYTNPDGKQAVFMNPPERVWTLSNTFTF